MALKIILNESRTALLSNIFSLEGSQQGGGGKYCLKLCGADENIRKKS